jgi:NAD/FAD-utilizing enzyme apparently involved in cell division
VHVTTIEGEAVSPAVYGGAVLGVNMSNNVQLLCKKLILTNGPFLNGLLHFGDKKIPAGRMGEVSSEGITEALNSLGLKSGRLKTGTPPRLYKNSINWEPLPSIDGDALPIKFLIFTHRSLLPPKREVLFQQTQ